MQRAVGEARLNCATLDPYLTPAAVRSFGPPNTILYKRAAWLIPSLPRDKSRG
jgi:hypothetical protein